MLSDADIALRLSGIGGSDVAAALGLDEHRRPIDVYLEKRGEAEPFAGNERTRWGQILEAPIADHYADHHPEVLVRGPFETRRCESRPWHLYTLDRVGLDPERLCPVRIVEIKSHGFRMAGAYGDEETDAVPFRVLCQVAWYMAGADLPEAHIAALFDTHEYREFHVERDPELEAHLLERVERFWLDHVVARVPPPADGSRSFARYAAQRWRKTSGEITCLKGDADLARTARAYRQVRALERLVKHAKPLLEQRLQCVIGADDGIDTDEGKITWRFDRRGRLNHTDLVRALAVRANISADELAELEDSCRHVAPRRFLAPRAWAKDRFVPRTDIGGFEDVAEELSAPDAPLELAPETGSDDGPAAD